MRINRSRPVTNPRITQALTEREEIREAADLLARDLAEARAALALAIFDRDKALGRADNFEQLLRAATDRLTRMRLDLNRAQGEASVLRTAPAGDIQLRHALHRSEALRADQDQRLAELASLPCPRPCCARVVTL